MERLPKGLIQSGIVLILINGALWYNAIRAGKALDDTEIALRIGFFVLALVMMAVGGVMKLLENAHRPPREDEEEPRDEFDR
jgi:hypothetical protein